ncbi:MAG: universal stress protein [Acidimicrobiia bacterium]|nr:universal stress protein [Acidimicrobiia bacterium]
MLALIATDGSDAALDAGRRAASLLCSPARIVFVTVIPEPESPLDTAGGIVGPAMTEAEAEEQARAERSAGQTVLDATVEALGDGAGERMLVEGNEVGPTLVRLAEEMDADVLVVGSEGKNLFQRLLVGSASSYVVRHATCPVLVVPEHEDDE